MGASFGAQVEEDRPTMTPREGMASIGRLLAWAEGQSPAGMLSLREAAAFIGYTESGLRKIVDRSKRGSSPAIEFFQSTRHAPLLFKRAWLEAFIGSCQPGTAPYRTRQVTIRPKKSHGLRVG